MTAFGQVSSRTTWVWAAIAKATNGGTVVDNLHAMPASEPVLTVYEKPTCTTCRKLLKLLTDRGIEFERVNYMVEPLSSSQLRELLAKAGLRPREVIRMKEPGARGLQLEDDEAVLSALEARPELLQRPIVERGERAVLARPPERVLELL
jgi:arsenate reductase